MMSLMILEHIVMNMVSLQDIPSPTPSLDQVFQLTPLLES